MASPAKEASVLPMEPSRVMLVLMDASSHVLMWTTVPAVFGRPALLESTNKLQEQIESIELAAKKCANAITGQDPLVSHARAMVACGAPRVARVDI